MKLTKRKKKTRFRGTRLQGWAAKKHKGSGNRGGVGMSGTGKRADHKKSYVIKYLYPYFGKQGFTSRKAKKKSMMIINVGDIDNLIPSLIKKGKAKETSSGIEINVKKHKILGRGEVKNKIIISSKSISESARKKIEKAGGKIVETKKEKEKDGA